MKKTTRFLLGGWLLIFLIGFFAGREQMKYQIQSAIVEWFSQAFGGLNNDQKEEKKKEEILVQPGEFHTFGEGEKTMKVKVRRITNLWEEQGKKLLGIALESENSGKKINFKSISWPTIELKDWAEYESNIVEQVPPELLPEWFGWCISCSNNPWEKDIEVITFELPANLNIQGAKLKLNPKDDVLFVLWEEEGIKMDDQWKPIL